MTDHHSKPPTEPGFYYFKHPNRGWNHVWVAQVNRVRSGELFATVYSDIPRDKISHQNVKHIQGRWDGPIEPPRVTL